MLLLRLKRKLHKAGIKLSLERLLEELSEIQLIAIKFYGETTGIICLRVKGREGDVLCVGSDAI